MVLYEQTAAKGLVPHCGSDQKRPLFKFVHSYFHGVIGRQIGTSPCDGRRYSSLTQIVVNTIQTHLRRGPNLRRCGSSFVGTVISAAVVRTEECRLSASGHRYGR
jgi:hypothetical protein